MEMNPESDWLAAPAVVAALAAAAVTMVVPGGQPVRLGFQGVEGRVGYATLVVATAATAAATTFPSSSSAFFSSF